MGGGRFSVSDFNEIWPKNVNPPLRSPPWGVALSYQFCNIMINAYIWPLCGLFLVAIVQDPIFLSYRIQHCWKLCVWQAICVITFQRASSSQIRSHCNLSAYHLGVLLIVSVQRFSDFHKARYLTRPLKFYEKFLNIRTKHWWYISWTELLIILHQPTRILKHRQFEHLCLTHSYSMCWRNFGHTDTPLIITLPAC